MNNKISVNDIRVDQGIFTVEDAKSAAEQIFSVQEEDFSKVKNAKWYQKLLRAVTFGAGDKKYIINDIRSLGMLQSLFMQIYVKQYSALDGQLRGIIENQAKTNRIVKSLLYSCVEKIRPQESPQKLNEHDKQILLLFLSQYHSLNNNEDRFRSYRASIAKACAATLPQGEFEPAQLSRVAATDTFYRCALELCALDDELESFTIPEDIYDALGHLNISPARKKELETALHQEISSFGTEYLLNKYNVQETGIDISDLQLEIIQDSIPHSEACEKHEQVKKAEPKEHVPEKPVVTAKTEQFAVKEAPANKAFASFRDKFAGLKKAIPGSQKSGGLTGGMKSCAKLKCTTDEAAEDYPEITALITQSIPVLYPKSTFQSEGTAIAKRKYETEKNRFFSEILQIANIAPNAVVEFVTAPKMLFTTAGLYFLDDEDGRKIHYIRYRDIDFEKTDTSSDGSGEGSFIRLCELGNNQESKLSAGNAVELLAVLKGAAAIETAESDTFLPIYQLPVEAKHIYSSLLVTFAKIHSLDVFEAIRISLDLMLPESALASLASEEVHTKNYSVENEREKYADLLNRFPGAIPYPSESVTGLALITNLIALIQFSTKRYKEITGREMSSLVETAEAFGIGQEELNQLIPNAQYPARLLNGDISVKETVQGFGSTFAVGGGLAAAAFVLSPLLGPVGILGAAGVFAGVINSPKKKSAVDELITRKNSLEQYRQKCREGYKSLFDLAASWSLSDDEISEVRTQIRAAAERNSISL